ncbi:4Fe-4S binding protein [bacterium]|nr:4Fe-4S binding protein [bacterium]
MLKLKLNAKFCISCGICMDVCPERAINMRIHNSSGVEGERLAYLALGPYRANELPPSGMMTFPWLANPPHCNGCMLCEKECPVCALTLQQIEEESAILLK